MGDFKMENYKPVAERLAEFKTKHPEGCLQPLNPDRPFAVTEIGGKTFIVYTAAAYRSPSDVLPGIASAWEPFPGPTPYTRDSELMNAETSAWGRAIVAALASDTQRGIATKEDVAARQKASEPAPALTDGWADATQEHDAHASIAARLAALPESHPVRVHARKARADHGWPMAAERLADLAGLVREAETAQGQPDSAGGQNPPPGAPEAPESALSGQSGDPEGDDGCSFCGEVIIGTRVFDDIGGGIHPACADELAALKGETLGDRAAKIGAKAKAR